MSLQANAAATTAAFEVRSITAWSIEIDGALPNSTGSRRRKSASLAPAAMAALAAASTAGS